MDLQGFNALEVDPNRGYEPIPVGEYKMVFIKEETKENSNGTGSRLDLVAQVIDGQYANRLVFETLHLGHNDPNKVAGARVTLSGICHAIGVLQPNNTADLLNKPFTAKVRIKPAKDGYDAKNVIARYVEKSGSATPTQTPQAGFSQPAWKK